MGKTILSLYSKSDVGRVRDHNEDDLCVLPDVDSYSKVAIIELTDDQSVVLAIADGMGGNSAGELAASIAIQAVISQKDKIDLMVKKNTGILAALNSVILFAHEQIVKAITPETKGMGTTIVLVLINSGQVHVAWCGDSRVYQYTNATRERKNTYDLPNLRILTNDHSIVWQMVLAGKLDPNQAREHELSHVITQSLGDPSNKPRPESISFSIEADDKILLCSDGLNSMLPDEYIQEILSHNNPLDEIVTALMEASNEKGGRDNISIILAQVNSVPAVLSTNPSRPEAITAKSNLSLDQSRNYRRLNTFKYLEVVLKSLIYATMIIIIFYFGYQAWDRFHTRKTNSLPASSNTSPALRDNSIPPFYPTLDTINTKNNPECNPTTLDKQNVDVNITKDPSN